MKVSQHVQSRIIIGSAVIVAAVILWHFAGLHDLFDELIAFMANAARHSGPAGAIAFIGLATLGAAIGPFTAVPLVPAALRVWGSLETGATLTSDNVGVCTGFTSTALNGTGSCSLTAGNTGNTFNVAYTRLL